MTLVKICGITNIDDAIVAIEAGADLLGLNFYPKSPRYVNPELAAAIVEEIRSHSGKQTKLVGLFVNESTTRIAEILSYTKLDYAQFHGDELPNQMLHFGHRAFRAIRPTDHKDALSQAATFYRQVSSENASDEIFTPRLLIDAHDPNLYGGTGKKADWKTAAMVAAQYAQTLLAGGLTPENVADAIATVRPWGVDVSSGVESAPGKKDQHKIKEFLKIVKE